MFGFWGFFKRNLENARPKEVAKLDSAVRMGLFGASNIAPSAIIAPAKTHPDVIISAIAARDEGKARSYAKKHGIPVVHSSYQAMLDDPSIDAVYIPLPNGLHYEWAVKALKANKHVLLEKPSTSNHNEAASLFRLPLLNQPNAPVLLEAFHSIFHPAWQRFLSLLDRENVTHVTVIQRIPKGIIGIDDIRFKYDLAGGAMMDFGTYGVALLRQIFASEPIECTDARYTPMPPGHDTKIDYSFSAQWRFPGGADAELEAELRASGGWCFPMLTGGLPRIELPRCVVQHRESLVPDEEASAQGQAHFRTRKVTFWNYVLPGMYHRLDIHDEHTVRNTADNKILKNWTESPYIKAYTELQQGGAEGPVWSSYRYMLEEFVNKVRGRPGSGIWWDAETSIKQMKVIDDAYTKMSLPVRPTSKYL
ncbi:hypothetical protein MMC30_007249 [Trapelia coarctata]|nr:hypothetical protein [Trapelia coarctata]